MLVAHFIERGGKLASQLAVLQVLLGRWSRIRKRQFAFLVILALQRAAASAAGSAYAARNRRTGSS